MEAAAAKQSLRKISSSCSFKLRSSPSLNSVRLRRIFDLFDKNNDNMLSVDELAQALNALGLESEQSELQSMIDSYIQLDSPGLKFEDFEALHRSLNEVLFEDEEEEAADEDSDLSEAFKVFDQDGDGFISAKELQVVLRKLGFPECGEIDGVEKMISNVDVNHDGRVDFVEFKDMMRPVIVLA
jgi:calcium-binding protein CML